MDTAEIWTDVATDGVKFVAVSRGSAVSSISSVALRAATWSSTAGLPMAANWSTISQGAGVWITAAAGTNVAAYSTDGVNWTAATLPLTQTWSSSAWSNGWFVLTCSDPTNTALVSQDGANWLVSTLPATAVWRVAAGGFKSLLLIAADQPITAVAAVE